MSWLHPILTINRGRAAYFHRYNKGRRAYLAKKKREYRRRKES